MVPTGLGVLMGCAGLMGWRIHPDSVTNLLSQTIKKQSLPQTFARLQQNNRMAEVNVAPNEISISDR